MSATVTTEAERLEAAQRMRARVMSVLPAGRYEMLTLLSLVDVVADDRCATAAVETGPQPRLLVNPDFIEEHCATDERLFMLIMHELYHVLLGHTRLWPRVTDVDNIVMDAVINSLLCRQFPEPAYTDLFTSLYSADLFPDRILRPPVGWHLSRRVLPFAARPGESAVMRLLYGKEPSAAGSPSMVTYDDVRALFDGAEGAGESEPPLLGDHSGPNGSGPADEAAVRDPLVSSALGQAVARWPQEGLSRAAGLGLRELQELLLGKPKPPRASFLEALRDLLRRAGITSGKRNGPLSWEVQPRTFERMTFEPTARDRTIAAKGELWDTDQLLYQDAVVRPAPRLRPSASAFVYLDVSGSMSADLPWLLSALGPLVRDGSIDVRLFSTMVAEVTRQDFAAGRVRTTGGTDIQCVYDHLLGLPRAKTPRRAVILTDGYTGRPTPDQCQATRQRGVQFYVGVIQGGYVRDLAPYVEAVVKLPALR